MNITTRFIIAIIYDATDLFLGRIPIFGTVYDILGTYLGYKLWGGWGLVQGLEILDITDQIDSFIPTLTIMGLVRLFVD
ncbi:hypothetical protein HOC80_03380 [archaeon]|jgi:hypothetical protein|nr:hypothetical protein [archaeon]MBT4417119.1 hypothetical protein [archaeon]